MLTAANEDQDLPNFERSAFIKYYIYWGFKFLKRN